MQIPSSAFHEHLTTAIETLHLFNVDLPDVQKHTMLYAYQHQNDEVLYILYIVGDIFLAKYTFFKVINFKLKQ